MRIRDQNPFPTKSSNSCFEFGRSQPSNFTPNRPRIPFLNPNYTNSIHTTATSGDGPPNSTAIANENPLIILCNDNPLKLIDPYTRARALSCSQMLRTRADLQICMHMHLKFNRQSFCNDSMFNHASSASGIQRQDSDQLSAITKYPQIWSNPNHAHKAIQRQPKGDLGTPTALRFRPCWRGLAQHA